MCRGALVSGKKPGLIESFAVSINIMTDMIYVYIFSVTSRLAYLIVHSLELAFV